MKNLPSDASDTTKTRHRRSHKLATAQINLRINEHFLSRIDEAVKQDCTSRSELIRIAIFWYLMPHHRNFEQSQEDYIFETIKHRKAIASSNKWFKEHGHEIDVYDS
ncbi:MAG TPA: ribbon-helix-helix domain-containing protein [Candidatus Saccharimonadales bacterium]|jgi:metal-responsive CopG/Arc/MetJ family transcriptional regulator|nr:ribbon-helix-helix domain-containing protein [Candidatus Saccharimonadales bacterium]